MKCLLAWLVLASGLVAAEPGAFSPAVADLAAVKAMLSERTNVRVTSGVPLTQAERVRQMSDFSSRVCAAALKVYETYPNDPLRWEAALIALRTLRSFVVEIKPGYEEAIAARDSAKIQSLIVRDDAARAAWEAKMDTLESALLAAPDVAPGVLAEAYANAIYRVTLQRGASAAERWSRAKPILEAMEQRVTDGTQLTRAFELIARFAQTADPDGYADFLRVRSQSPIAAVATWATGKANVQAGKVQSLEMKFTALDGREVDLAQLRGKVVLIDFWATWCGPCKEELPNVLANYRKYHDQGLEVIAISLDAEKDRQTLIDFVREHQLPWPQHFDGRGWKNEFATRFGVRAIPAMFLLDQTGKVVTTEARGPKLETEIRRLLQLDAAPAVDAEGARKSMLAPGVLAPDFVSLTSDGRPVRVSDYRGRVLILDFWATWCGPCIASMPHTQQIAAKYADQGVTVLAVCTGDKRKRFEDWVSLKASAYPALRFTFDPHDQDTPARDQRASRVLYGVPSIPTQFIIDREGRIAGTTNGYRPGDTSLEHALAAAGVTIDVPAAVEKSVTPKVVADVPATGGPRLVAPAAADIRADTAATAGVRRVAPPFTESVGKVKAGDLLVDVEFQGSNGAPSRLSDFRGKPLVLLFAPAEMIPEEYLNGIVEHYGASTVQVLALVTRDTEENYRAWLGLHGARGNRFMTAFDPVPASDPRRGVINRLFQFGAPTPLSMVVDAEGKFAGLFPWKLPQGRQGLAELLRRCGVPVKAEDLPASPAAL
ncbi:MAG: redoxin domain-containing protein [Opitutaceae bacterium]|jgi:peroxiredoxin|nr:redoxin domain-containing protein [Opitutaceae bacterium]